MYIRPHTLQGLAASHLKRWGWERVDHNEGRRHGQGFLSLGLFFLNVIW